MPRQIHSYIEQKLAEQRKNHAFRQLHLPKPGSVDFTSNDYLGLARVGSLPENGHFSHGSGGSRLLSGNFEGTERLENQLADFHEAPSALIFNSGYDANLGLLSAIARDEDTIFYDILSHASLRDGIRLSRAGAFPFLHNDLVDLGRRLEQAKGVVYVVTESLFSMDGNFAPLAEMVDLCEKAGAYLIVDEAHATGVVGRHGGGLVQELGLQERIFARVHTFGKAVGCHGAAVLGSRNLKDFLINFSRPLIYTTALPPSSVAAIQYAYTLFPGMDEERLHLHQLIQYMQEIELPMQRLMSSSPIQGVIIPGNKEVTVMANRLQEAGLDCRPIRYPTVPRQKERIRIVLHSFNTIEEINLLAGVLRKNHR
jgi:8-amino-7-oxononanoate synthase